MAFKPKQVVILGASAMLAGYMMPQAPLQDILGLELTLINFLNSLPF